MATRPGVPTPLLTRRLAGRAVKSARRNTSKVKLVIGRTGFPYRAPKVPNGIDVPDEASKLGADFETDWARKAPAKLARRVITNGPLLAAVKYIADPKIEGVDRLADLKELDDPPAIIFAPNHHSHIDTPISITSIPEPWRHKLVVAAAADYFFTSRVKGSMAAVILNALPIDRETVSRKSSNEIKGLIAQGWSLVIYPEGGRSPDGWGQEFKGGAAYLSRETGAPVVPMFIEGSGSIYGKGMKRPKPGKTKVTFGSPMFPDEGESTRRFGQRIERAVTALGDESLTDWYTARRNAAAGTSPSLAGPEHMSWRRNWALDEQRNRGMAGERKRQKRRWPKFD
jgi:1-acyl-sn-glycerol-3-phosphate acyltransferase